MEIHYLPYFCGLYSVLVIQDSGMGLMNCFVNLSLCHGKDASIFYIILLPVQLTYDQEFKSSTFNSTLLFRALACFYRFEIISNNDHLPAFQWQPQPTILMDSLRSKFI